MAGSKTQHLLWGLALGALTATTLAQRTAQSTAKHPIEASAPSVPKSTSYRLLTSDDGLAIIGAALESRHLRSNGDCSHLVHAIYELAGFRYRYADSSQLYDGIGTFRQVTHPQPGDLAVWRGHAAIVINPAQHSFFGSTRSGLRVESYESEYWKRRGSPRFFRYLKPVRPPSFQICAMRKRGHRLPCHEIPTIRHLVTPSLLRFRLWAALLASWLCMRPNPI
jgi:hypothetical protein